MYSYVVVPKPFVIFINNLFPQESHFFTIQTTKIQVLSFLPCAPINELPSNIGTMVLATFS